MKTYTCFSCIGLLITLMLFSITVMAEKDNFIQEYETGFAFFELKDYAKADTHFRISFELKAHAQTAYFLARSNYQLRNPKLAKRFAEDALTSSIFSLEQEKQAFLKNLIKVIQEEAVDQYVRVHKQRERIMLENSLVATIGNIQLIERQREQARQQLEELGINPNDIDNSLQMLIPDKCLDARPGGLTPEEFNRCMERLSD